MNPDDRRLISESLAGRTASFGALVLRYQDRLYHVANRVLDNPDDALDVVQDTFVAVWSSAGRYSGKGPVAAWVWGIGYRQLLHAIRPRHSVIERLMAQRPGEAISAEEELLTAVEHGDLGSALGRLSPELRAVVQATVLDGLTCREAGRLLGIPSGTVKTRMMRARHELREALA